MDSKDVLKNALLQYTGTLILVSHDRDFLQGLTDSLFEFRDGEVHEFKGDIFEFLEWRRLEDLKQLDSNNALKHSNNNSTSQSNNQPIKQSKLDYQQSKERERELRKLRNEVAKLEEEISNLEQQVADIEAKLASGTTDPSIFENYQNLKTSLEQKISDWEEAVISLETAQSQ